MAEVAGNGLRFVPSRVEGLPDVSEVGVYPDRLEFLSDGRWVVFWLADIVEWPDPRWVWKSLARLGWRRGGDLVGDRDWFHAPPDRFFRFYTDPPITVYMPTDDTYSPDRSCFQLVKAVLGAGGFGTFDLG